MMYRVLAGIIRFVVLLIWGLDMSGGEHIPEDTGAIVAGNHTSWFDPFVLVIAIRRPVHFMAKAELFANPILRWILPRVHVFPVRRGQADRQAIRISQERVNEGNLVGMFPEGTRNKTENPLLAIQGGAALIAIKTGVPIIPVVIKKGQRRGLRRPFIVSIGTPIDLGGPGKATKTDIARGSKAISAQFSSLLSRNN